MCEKPPALAVHQGFGFRTALEIEVPRRMHVVAAKGRNHDKIGSILEIKHRRCSLPPCFPALRSKHHEGRCAERIP